MFSRKINILTVCALVMILFSCEEYEAYVKDYEHSAVYFGTQKPLRTIVAYDEMSFKTGVVLAGKLENDREEWVTYSVDPTLLTGTPFTLLPEEYYSISNNETIVIPKGKVLGDVTVTLNRDLFTSDPLAHLNTYALPLRLLETSADSILSGQFDENGVATVPARDYTVLVVKYISPLHGVYYHKGVEQQVDALGNVVEEKTYNTADLSKNLTWELSTLALDEVLTPGAGTFTSQGSDSYGLEFVRNEDNTVTIEAVAGSDLTLLEGAGTYDETKREFYLNYKFTESGLNYHVMDTLILRQPPEKDLRFEEW